MSTKSTKQGKKLSVPRTMAEIQAAYQQLCANAGQVQYQLMVQSKELEKINGQLEAINKEAFARQKLDSETAKDNSMQAEAGV